MSSLRLSDLRFIPAPSQWQDKGHLGWVSGVLDDRLGVGCIGLRRTRAGEYTLSFPCEKDKNGRVHHHFWPVDDQARRDLEAQVIGELRERGVLP